MGLHVANEGFPIATTTGWNIDIRKLANATIESPGEVAIHASRWPGMELISPAGAFNEYTLLHGDNIHAAEMQS